jgi:hypothetical protein
MTFGSLEVLTLCLRVVVVVLQVFKPVHRETIQTFELCISRPRSDKGSRLVLVEKDTAIRVWRVPLDRGWLLAIVPGTSC